MNLAALTFNGPYTEEKTEEFSQLTGLDYSITKLEKLEESAIVCHNESYAVTGFHIFLSRNWGRSFFYYYVPSGLIVAISWISFTIPIEGLFF